MLCDGFDASEVGCHFPDRIRCTRYLMQGNENLRVVAVVPAEKAEYWMGGSARSDYG